MPSLCKLVSPLADSLLFSRMQVSERLSELFVIQLEAVSERADIQPKELLGKLLVVEVTHHEGPARTYSGYATRLVLGGSRGRFFVYHLTLHPWPWFLSRTADCRIFQQAAVPDIIDQVMSDETTKAFKRALEDAGKYLPREYCVQYRETDLNFISRLMEEEGLYYYFTQKDGEHTFVLVDRNQNNPKIAGDGTIRFDPNPDGQARAYPFVSAWTLAQQIQPGQFVLDDYDFKKPGLSLQVIRRPQVGPAHAKADYEVYDYPGLHDSPAEGEAYVADRIEEIHTQAAVFEGAGQVETFSAGHRFSLADHPREGWNVEYLLLSVDYDYEDPPPESGGSTASRYRCRFTAIDANQQYRPPRVATRPLMRGIQTAVVAGPAGEEIHTDAFGRIKVQFRWDRLGNRDEKSSCWLRVAFLAAGPRFGFVSIPRIGHEVVVDFLEGDPDRPLVTGVVYNGDNMPPWALPANQTQSGLLTRSSKGGVYDDANAIRFEDKKGAEVLWLHAQKDQTIEVENDEAHSVGHDRSKSIGHDETVSVGNDRTEKVGRNEQIAIGVNRDETVGANESVSIGANRTHTVGASETWTVALQRTHTVGVNETIAIGAAQQIAIGAMQTLAIGASQSVTVGGSQSASIGKNQVSDVGDSQTQTIGKDRSGSIGGNDTLQVAKDQAISIGEGRATNVGKDDALTVGKNLVISAGDSITFSTGSASLSMKKDGTIVIKGKDITVEGSGKINVKAASNVVIKGSKIVQN